MSSEFAKPSDHAAPSFTERRARTRPAPTAAPRRHLEPGSVEARHRKWFGGFADEHVAPLLADTVAALKDRGYNAHCRIAKDADDVTGELVIVPPGLPPGSPPPRFTVAAAPGPNGLTVEFTGTFPHAGAGRQFGGEVQYDTIHTGELEATLMEFVRLATGS